MELEDIEEEEQEERVLHKINNFADPNRCQGNDIHGQCMFMAKHGFKYCAKHNAAGAAAVIRKEIRNYRLTQWQARMEEFADNDKVKSLREEIGILRILLEENFNKCQSAMDIVLYSGKISDLVLKIEKLVVSCHRLEQSTGLLLDKSAIINLANNIILIIANNVKDDRIISVVSDQILDTILKQNNMVLTND